jgi:hypothetical protein
MSLDTDRALVEKVKQQLDQHAEAVDDVTAARLGAARRSALEKQSLHRYHWMPLGSVAAAAAVIVVSFMLMQQPETRHVELDFWAAGDDLELIEELDFYAWLEEMQSNS